MRVVDIAQRYLRFQGLVVGDGREVGDNPGMRRRSERRDGRGAKTLESSQ